jgi:CRISPR-associated protein Csb1
MVAVKELLERLVEACALEGDDALVVFRTRLRPVEGEGAKVMPPTYPRQREGELPAYVIEPRLVGGERSETVLLDSFSRRRTGWRRRYSMLVMPLVLRCRCSS